MLLSRSSWDGMDAIFLLLYLRSFFSDLSFALFSLSIITVNEALSRLSDQHLSTVPSTLYAYAQWHHPRWPKSLVYPGVVVVVQGMPTGSFPQEPTRSETMGSTWQHWYGYIFRPNDCGDPQLHENRILQIRKYNAAPGAVVGEWRSLGMPRQIWIEASSLG